VRLLAAAPPDCGPACVVAPVFTLIFLVVLVIGAVLDVRLLHKKHGHLIAWKPAKKHETPDAVGDPWMRLRAKARIQTVSLGIMAAERASVVRERAGNMARHASLSIRLPRPSSARVQPKHDTAMPSTPTIS
jgi:hypothetical protein